MKRLLIAVVSLVTVLATAFAGTALGGASNTRTPYQETNEVTSTTLCSFPVVVDSTMSGFDLYHFDKNGIVVSGDRHFTEVDTLTANGKSLTGPPYSGMLHATFDSNFNLITLVGTGGVAAFVLPDGTLWRAAGHSNPLNWVDPWVWHPDLGHSPDPAPLCAALS